MVIAKINGETHPAAVTTTSGISSYQAAQTATAVTITVNGSADGILTDYTVPVTVRREAGSNGGGAVYLGADGCRVDFKDISFTDNAGNPLDFYMESGAECEVIGTHHLTGNSTQGLPWIYGGPSKGGNFSGNGPALLYGAGTTLDGVIEAQIEGKLAYKSDVSGADTWTFQFPATKDYIMTAEVADFDSDGTLEVYTHGRLQVTTDDHFHCYLLNLADGIIKASGTVQRNYWNGSYGSNYALRPAFGHFIPGQTYKQLAVAVQGAKITVLQTRNNAGVPQNPMVQLHVGAELFPSENVPGGLQPPTIQSMTACDIDGDGLDEIILQSADYQYKATVSCLKWNANTSTFEILWSIQGDIPSQQRNNENHQIFEQYINGTLTKCVAYTFRAYTERMSCAGVCLAATGVKLWEKQVPYAFFGGAVQCYLWDVNLDGIKEMICFNTVANRLSTDDYGHVLSVLYAFDLRTGDLVYTQTLPELTWGWGNVADMDGDGIDDLILPMFGHGETRIFSPARSTLARFWVKIPTIPAAPATTTIKLIAGTTAQPKQRGNPFAALHRFRDVSAWVATPGYRAISPCALGYHDNTGALLAGLVHKMLDGTWAMTGSEVAIDCALPLTLTGAAVLRLFYIHDAQDMDGENRITLQNESGSKSCSIGFNSAVSTAFLTVNGSASAVARVSDWYTVEMVITTVVRLYINGSLIATVSNFSYSEVEKVALYGSSFTQANQDGFNLAAVSAMSVRKYTVNGPVLS